MDQPKHFPFHRMQSTSRLLILVFLFPEAGDPSFGALCCATREVNPPPPSDDQYIRHPDPEDDLCSYRESGNTPETSTPNQGRQHESTAK